MREEKNNIKKIGITGASGNIGTTLRQGLAEKYALHLYDLNEIKDKSEGEFVRIDFADKAALEGIFNGLDALIHLAGDPRPDAPAQLTFRNNFVGTSYVFEEARKAGMKKIIFASSNFYHQGSVMDALQGRLKGLIPLDMLPTPRCLYAQSKVFGESVGLHLSNFGIQFVALRIGWTIPEDNPAYYGGNYMKAMFCSKRDLVQAFDKALEIGTDFLTAFAISDNTQKVFDLTETKEKLRFHPLDNSENYF